MFPVRYSSATLCFPNFHFILNILAFVASFWFLICFFVFLFTSFFLLCCLSYLFCICLFLGFFHSCHPHLPFLNSPLPFQLTTCFPSASISCLPSNPFICHVLLLSEFLCLLHFVFSFFLFIFPFLFIFLSAYLSVLLTFDSFFCMFLPFSLHSPSWTSAWLTFTLITSSSLSLFLFSFLITFSHLKSHPFSFTSSHLIPLVLYSSASFFALPLSAHVLSIFPKFLLILSLFLFLVFCLLCGTELWLWTRCVTRKGVIERDERHMLRERERSFFFSLDTRS